MPNLTLAIDAETLKRARIRALEEGTSVNAVVRDQLRRYAGRNDEAGAIREFLDLTRELDTGSGGKRDWSREELYEGRLEWPRRRS